MTKVFKNVMKFTYEDMMLPVLCLLFFILAFCFEAPIDVFKGYIDILLSKSILITDYLGVGGLGATCFNVATILLFNMIVLKKMRIEINGPIFAGLMMILGFSFFGKNILNTLPIYLGIYLYSKVKKSHFKNYIISVLFSTGISPVVSYTMFSLPLYIGIPLGILVGVAVGFIIPTISSHTILFHKGYNLFNTGFALGIISVLCYAIYETFGINVVTEKIICYDYHNVLLILSIAISAFYIIMAFVTNRYVIKDYLKILPKSGRLVTDFIKEGGRSVVMLNYGLLGVIITIFVLMFKIDLNGMALGSIIACLGFASYGVHIKNALPIWLGAILGIWAKGLENFSDPSTVVSFFFCIGLAPIAGKYGIIYGLLAGFLHIMITPLMIGFQGGFDLYNNGFSAGFVAMIIVNIKEALTFREKEY